MGDSTERRYESSVASYSLQGQRPEEVTEVTMQFCATFVVVLVATQPAFAQTAAHRSDRTRPATLSRLAEKLDSSRGERGLDYDRMKHASPQQVPPSQVPERPHGARNYRRNWFIPLLFVGGAVGLVLLAEGLDSGATPSCCSPSPPRPLPGR